MSRLFVIGLSHHSAPVEIREALAVSGEALGQRVTDLRSFAEEVMLVSTCNRFEVYLALPDPAGCEAVEQRLLRDQPRAHGHLYRHEGEAALRHLFRVAASLDSLVVGEPQILGQVKDAFAAAQAAGTVGPLLSRVMPRCFAAAKRARSETAIGDGSASVASAAVTLAGHIFGDLRGQPVLIVGAGKMAELAARHLQAAQVDRLWVVNRTRARADELARRLSGTAYDFSELEALLGRAAVVVSSTGAQEPVLRHELMARVMKARRGRWLLLLDIAVPRDVEPRVGGLENVYLYDIDALQQVVAEHVAKRRSEAEAAERIVGEEVARFLSGERAQGVAPTIRQLRERALQVARAEVERTLPRLSAPSERDRQLIGQMAEAVVNKLLHAPLTALKRDAAASGGPAVKDLEQAVRVLFSLDQEGGP